MALPVERTRAGPHRPKRNEREGGWVGAEEKLNYE